jgi:PilZ domain
LSGSISVDAVGIARAERTAMAPPESDEYERGAPRRRVLKAAQIVYEGGQTVIECMIRDISDSGAKIDTEVALALPSLFWVVLPDGARRPAKLVWQNANLLGVHFTDSQPGVDAGRSALIARIAGIEKQLADLRAEILAGRHD